MASSGNLGVCVIGGGRAGMIHARNFASGRVPRAELAALVEPVEETRKSACRELGLESSCRPTIAAL